MRFFKKENQANEEPKKLVYTLAFSVNGIIHTVQNESMEAIENLRDALIKGMARAVEGDVFVHDAIGYAAGQVKSYTVSKIETKESE